MTTITSKLGIRPGSAAGTRPNFNKCFSLLVLTILLSPCLRTALATETNSQRWSVETARAWQQDTGWLVGCNFLPSTAINQLEMFQADSFDLETIDRELGWAQSLGLNSVRVYLHNLLWDQDAQGFLDRLDKFLAVAARHEIGVMFVLFDSCWDPHPKLGPQRAPKSGVHNSGWVQSPGAEVLLDPARQPALEAYVAGVVGRFRNDPRVQVWDVWNEPDNMNRPAYIEREPANKVELVLPLLRKAFAWARRANPSQPLTSGLWIGTWPDPEKLSPTEQLQLSRSDVISFHNYSSLASLSEAVENLKRYHRPLLCTEYMSRGNGSLFEPNLGYMKSAGVAAYSWGLVDGKSQTIYPWDSWTKAYDAEPELWFHDIFRRNGQPYRPSEVTYIREVIQNEVISATDTTEFQAGSMSRVELARTLREDPVLPAVLDKAKALLKTGLTAGGGYGEVWIRDLNTFIELALEVNDTERLRDSLLTFFKFQGADGNIVDGYIPEAKANVGYNYRRSPLAPRLLAHKNTVETDQESSLVQAVARYVRVTGNRSILSEPIDGVTVLQRLGMALNYVLTERFDAKHGLVWGGTTSDWGDVQPEHDWGVELDANSHRCIDIYDNALLVIAINEYVTLLDDEPQKARWSKRRDALKRNVRRHLWDAKKSKFVAHLYLEGSPFPKDFDESAVYYHGGTAVAIEAGLLSRDEIKQSLELMRANVRAAGASSIGLTLYPVYPDGAFKNRAMAPYSYQNGGDWCWFGGRMIRQLIRYGFVEDAYVEVQPMLSRVLEHGDFHEWWSRDNQPRGSNQFRGSAGVLGVAIEQLLEWSEQQREPIQDHDEEPLE